MAEITPKISQTLEAFNKGWRRVSKKPVVLSEPDRAVLWGLVRDAHKAHRFDGAAGMGSLPILLFRIADKKVASPLRQWLAAESTTGSESAFIALPYGWPGTFGGMLTVTVTVLPQEAGSLKPRVCIPKSHAVFDRIQSGRFLAAFAVGDSLLGAREIDFGSEPACGALFSEQWNNVRNHEPLLPDGAAEWWKVLDLVGAYRDHFSASDRLSLGWVKRYETETRIFEAMLKEYCESEQIPKPADLAPENKVLYDSIESCGGKVAPVLGSLRALQQANPRTISKLAMTCGQLPTRVANEPVGVRELVSAATLLQFFSSEMTSCGTQLPCMDGDGVIRNIEIEPRQFPEPFGPGEYWLRQTRSLRLHWRKYITGHDLPVNLRSGSETWERFSLVDDPEGAEASANALLDEAVSDKKWTIPRGATVELPLGPFVRMNVFEHGQEIAFVARTAADEFAIMNVEPRQRHFDFDSLDCVPPEQADVIAAGAKLLLSAVIRDFWVLEQRESVFAHRRSPSGQDTKKKPEEETVVVYLPRIQYTARPKLDQCAAQLDHQERRAHHVRPHLRRADRASDYQMILARKYSFDIPAGYTFVRPHERGQAHREVIYRSRSALQSLYDTTAQAQGDTSPTAWFSFERKMRMLLESMGFVVQHVSAPDRMDSGADFYATKGDEMDLENWIIQCKSYSNKVSPRVVRDLIGSLANYPNGTRGMIITTGGFSSGAIALAHGGKVHLIDGPEVTRRLAILLGHRSTL